METIEQYTLEELKKKLTNKERIFCHQYIIDWNGSRAARAAGYSEKSCRQIADQNMSKLHIQQYIGFIKNNIEQEAGISKLMVVNELKKIVFTSIAHMHNTWIERKEFNELSDEQKASIESIESKIQKKYNGDKDDPQIVDVEFVKIKLFSKVHATEQLNKMLGYNLPEKVDMTTNGKDINPLPQLSDDERRARIEQLKEKMNAD
ncbi:MAG: terminase small subunit [Chlorobium sp.]|nr:terminase small subunit [Chlorobium sp.]